MPAVRPRTNPLGIQQIPMYTTESRRQLSMQAKDAFAALPATGTRLPNRLRSAQMSRGWRQSLEIEGLANAIPVRHLGYV